MHHFATLWFYILSLIELNEKPTIFSFFSLVLCFSFFLVRAQPIPVVIRLVENNISLIGVTVELRDRLDSSRAFYQLTDTSGIARFSVVAGQYTIIANYIGFTPFRKGIRPIFAIGKNYINDIFTNVIYQSPTDPLVSWRTYDNLGKNEETYFRLLGAIPPGGKYFFVVGT